jgi:hypothetical protein
MKLYSTSVKRAYDHVQKALQLKHLCSVSESALIDALSHRYKWPYEESEGTKELEQAYSQQLELVHFLK